MPRGLDSTMAAALAHGSIEPVFLAELTFASGKTRAWSGIGDLVWNGKTFSGVGSLGAVGNITETSAVEAQGTTVTLYGLSQLAQQPTPPGVTPPAPPVTPAAGQSVAWAYPTTVAGSADGTGIATPALYSGEVQIVATLPPVTTGDRGSAKVTWSGFTPPPLPADAVVQAVYPTIVISEYNVSESAFFRWDPRSYTGVGMHYDPALSGGLSDLNSVATYIELAYSLDGAVFSDSVVASFVGCAVYYTSASGIIPPSSMLQEALTDAAPGGPAKIWFGLWSSALGTFVGTPYLIFSGIVDDATIAEDPTGTKIVLALENRLRNLMRASQKLYTAADQKLSYPSDSGFNCVEILQEISLNWGN